MSKIYESWMRPFLTEILSLTWLKLVITHFRTDNIKSVKISIHRGAFVPFDSLDLGTKDSKISEKGYCDSSKTSIVRLRLESRGTEYHLYGG